MKDYYDIVVLGAGPAGSNFARCIDSNRYDVLIVDGKKWRKEKPCGGLISPDAQDLLAKYNLNLPKEVLVNPQLFSVKTIDLGTEQVKYYRRSYMNVDREKFDQFFVNMISKKVDKLEGICLNVEKYPDRYRLTIKTEQDEKSIYCRFVVGADGANSVVRRKLYPKERVQRYTAIQQWFEAGDENPYYSCIFDEESSPSCSWIFFKDGKMIFGGAFESVKCREAFEMQKKKLVDKGFVQKGLFDIPIKTEACQVVRPHWNYGVFQGREGAFLIGEAAGFISASSLEGISFALKSGESLAKAFEDEQDVMKSYEKKTGMLRMKVVLKCLKRPFMYQPFLRKLVMKSGITSIKVQE